MCGRSHVILVMNRRAYTCASQMVPSVGGAVLQGNAQMGLPSSTRPSSAPVASLMSAPTCAIVASAAWECMPVTSTKLSVVVPVLSARLVMQATGSHAHSARLDTSRMSPVASAVRAKMVQPAPMASACPVPRAQPLTTSTLSASHAPSGRSRQMESPVNPAIQTPTCTPTSGASPA